MAVDSTDQFVQSELRRGVEARLTWRGFTVLCASSVGLFLLEYQSALVPAAGVWRGLCLALVVASALAMVFSTAIASRFDV